MKRVLTIPVEFPWGQLTYNKKKLTKGFIHQIERGTDWAMYDLALFKLDGMIIDERRVHNVIPITIYMDKKNNIYQVLINHQCVSGLTLYRMVVGCGLSPSKFEKMLNHWTKDGNELFIGQLVVWEMIEDAYPYVPYSLQVDSKRVPNEIREASKLLYRLDQTRKGKGLVSPVLGYEFLMLCDQFEVELNFQQWDDENNVGVFTSLDGNKTGLTINPVQKDSFFPTKKRPIELVTEKLQNHRFVKN